MVNPFAQKNMFMNFIYVLCGPISPQKIDYQEKICEDYYSRMEVLTKEMRMQRDKTNQSFIPIPSIYFFKETLKRFQDNCEKFNEEFEFLTGKYLKNVENESAVVLADLVSDGEIENKVTNQLLENDDIKFLYQVI